MGAIVCEEGVDVTEFQGCFFNFVMDIKGNIYYFNLKERQDIQKKIGKAYPYRNHMDTHVRICYEKIAAIPNIEDRVLSFHYDCEERRLYLIGEPQINTIRYDDIKQSLIQKAVNWVNYYTNTPEFQQCMELHGLVLWGE